MNTAFRSSFDRDLKQIKDEALRNRIGEIILQVEAASALTAVPGVKPFAGRTFESASAIIASAFGWMEARSLSSDAGIAATSTASSPEAA